jgi:hypothetical protein
MCSCADAMNNEESNTHRDALLARLAQMAADDADSGLSQWCQTHQENSLRSLRKIDAAQIPSLVDRSLAAGGVFLRDM